MSSPMFAPSSRKQEMFLQSDAYITVYGGAAGSGKAQPLYSKVLTTNGWKTMGEVQVGDAVITPKNIEAEVLETFYHEAKEIYEITTQSGNIVRACNEHLWQVDVVDSGESSTEVCDTDDIINYITLGCEVSIPICDAIGSERDIKLPLPPYRMGAMIAATSLRQEQSQRISKKYLHEASINQRLDLLKGMSDSYQKDTNAVLIKGEALCSDVVYLIKSLGGLADISCEDDKYLIKYKLSSDGRLGDKIVSVSYVGVEEAKCIYIDDPEHLYLTDGFTVTHNTYMGLMRFLLYVDDPEFVGYVFRLNATQMKKGGGIFPTACKMFRKYDPNVRITKQPMEITFSSGATINFVGLEGEAALESIRGIQISAAMIDEGHQVGEDDVFWVTSRLRTLADMIPNLWITCNPTPDSFLRKWLEPNYLYPRGTIIDNELVEGRADQEKDGKLIWFLRVGNSLEWGETKEELFDAHSTKFPIDKRTGTRACYPRSFKFISANCFDNPILLESDPNYVSSLLNMPRVEKERLFFGNWFVKEETSSYFQRDWAKVASMQSLLDGDRVIKRIRAWDLAYTQKSEQNPDPDYTAGVLIAYTAGGQYIVEDVVHGRWTAGELNDMLAKQIKADEDMYGRQCINYLPQEPAGAGVIARRFFATELNKAGCVHYRFFKVGSQKSKLDRFQPFSSAAANELVCVVDAEWNDLFFNELEVFTGSRSKNHDDIVDAVSDAYNNLATSKPLPVVDPKYMIF